MAEQWPAFGPAVKRNKGTHVFEIIGIEAKEHSSNPEATMSVVSSLNKSTNIHGGKIVLIRTSSGNSFRIKESGVKAFLFRNPGSFIYERGAVVAPLGKEATSTKPPRAVPAARHKSGRALRTPSGAAAKKTDEPNNGPEDAADEEEELLDEDDEDD